MAQKSRGSMTFIDHGGESSTISFLIPTLSDALASDDLHDAAGEMRTLRDAILAVTLGVCTQISLSWVDFNVALPPTDKAAQRESKWLVTIMDNEETFSAVPPVPNPGYGRKFNMELPCADLSILPDTAQGVKPQYMDLTAGPGAALKAAVEDLVLAASGGNVEVLQVEHVGRST